MILHGYCLINFPITTGSYELEVPLWRPLGSADQELRSFLLGETPSLLVPDPIYESAWKDRARIITTSCGKIKFNLFVMTRFFHDQGIMRGSSSVEKTS
jgi:hypothetical protein